MFWWTQNVARPPTLGVRRTTLRLRPLPARQQRLRQVSGRCGRAKGLWRTPQPLRLSRVCPLLLVLPDAVVPHHIEDRRRAERAAHEEGGGGGHEQRQLEREQSESKW